MVGGAAALLRKPPLSRPALIRLAIGIGFLGLLGLYYGVSEQLPNVSEPADVVWVFFVVTAIIFAPVYLGLGLRGQRGLIPGAIVSALLATLLHLSGAQLAASIPKLAAAALVGFLFLRLCEQVWILVLVALLASAADTLSVWRGPTNQIVTSAPQVFDALSVASPYPGERMVTLSWGAAEDRAEDGYLVYRRRYGDHERSLTNERFCTSEDDCGSEISFYDSGEPADIGAVYHVVAFSDGRPAGRATVSVPARGGGGPRLGARSGLFATQSLEVGITPATAGLGVSDVIFFALFLGGAARFGLRSRATWLALVISIGMTGVLAVYGDFFGLNGLPALPGISLAFLVVNADLIWRRAARGEEIDLDSRSSAERPERPS